MHLDEVLTIVLDLIVDAAIQSVGGEHSSTRVGEDQNRVEFRIDTTAGAMDSKFLTGSG